MPKDSAKKLMTTVKLPATTEQRMLERIIADRYKLRGKSRWMIEAIEDFLTLPNYAELVNIASELEQLDKIVSLRLPEALMKKLDNALIDVRKVYPEMEGVKSNIIRASIMQRLLRSSSVTD